ncbi:MAG: dihydropteroate synthase [Candidatus Marinimicrobia bacterium]|nr:dihydropteroate synthase [Candidatus Neomarinimicrobiota bacterium]
MGILNTTPDSFSDGGLFLDSDSACNHALHMVNDGADIIDIGGESSRPGAEGLDIQTELDRVIPVIEEIRRSTDNVISIDTTKPDVAEAALKAGANIINDISGFRNNAMIIVAVKYQKPVIVMHMQGDPRTMQQNPTYENVVLEVRDYLLKQAEKLENAGFDQKNIIIDPGIGFGKTVEDNFAIIRDLKIFTATGYPVLMGPSRKSFIGHTLDLPPDKRLEGTAAAVTASVMNGADILRVHDVKEMKRVVTIAERFR